MNDSTEYYEDTKPELYVSLDGFEGPLDLLLTLAKSQKVDLKKLQLGILAEQFLKYLRDQRFKSKLEFVGDYLVMASWLTLLKSQLIRYRISCSFSCATICGKHFKHSNTSINLWKHISCAKVYSCS